MMAKDSTNSESTSDCSNGSSKKLKRKLGASSFACLALIYIVGYNNPNQVSTGPQGKMAIYDDLDVDLEPTAADEIANEGIISDTFNSYLDDTVET